MKKFKKTALLSLCLSPLLLLTACVSPPNFSITASSSDTQLGYVQGFDKTEMSEGTKVTLSAYELKENPFICWVKDNKKIVSQESKISLTYNSSNEGHYTAIFEESDISKMQYATITDIEFTPTGYTKVEYNLTTALLTSGSSDYYEFASGNYSIGEEHATDTMSVVYFGSTGDSYEYLLKINLKITDSQNAETSIEFQLQTKVNKNSFDNEGNCIVEESVTGFEDKLSLKLTKLNSTIYSNTIQ